MKETRRTVPHEFSTGPRLQLVRLDQRTSGPGPRGDSSISAHHALLVRARARAVLFDNRVGITATALSTDHSPPSLAIAGKEACRRHPCALTPYVP